MAYCENLMINIISRSANTNIIGGQAKVFRNLVKGLEKTGYPYVVNRRLDACERLWIHDDIRALPLIKKLPYEIKVVVGPNLYVMPRDMPKNLDLSRAIYLHPSEWAVNLWKAHGFNLCPLRAWPVGIETDLFSAVGKKQRNQVMVYHKCRRPCELAMIEKTVSKLGLKYQTIIYGNYTQQDYLHGLRYSKYLIWHGRHESQGIALQEALARDVPILLLDATSFNQFWTEGGHCYAFNEQENKFPVTSAPYFDDTCGVRITRIEHLKDSILEMEERWREFKPRDYILQNLSLEKQAKALLAFYSYWGLTIEGGELRNSGFWNPPITWIFGGIKRRIKGYLGYYSGA